MNVTAINSIYLNEDTGGKGRFFKSRFLQAGLVKYQFGVCLLKKETIDKFVNTFIGCPVVINHQDVTDESAKEQRVGVISRVYFEPSDAWFWCEGVLFDNEAIDLVQKGYTVSCQYEITEYSDNPDGELHNGNPYDKEILDGRFEHLAIVDSPRYEDAIIAVNSKANEYQPMNLKDLVGIVADTNISETILDKCAEIGADCFPSIEGLPKVISNKQGGMYFDQVANQIWFVNAIQRNVFNLLATTRTKVPQTEVGMNMITTAIKEICNQAVTNGYVAPGIWNSADTFGNLEDFHRNIEEVGFYIYHQPVAEQTQNEREQRKAPLFQIAAKEAGSVHSANILIYLEA